MVCGLTRLMAMMPSAANAAASQYTRYPSAVTPTSIASIDDTMGQPSVASSSPRLAITSRWPSAVAPPCEPIAGTTKGSPPRSRTQPATAPVASAIRSMPRLPPVSAIRAPGAMPAPMPDASSARRTATATSGNVSSAKR